MKCKDHQIEENAQKKETDKNKPLPKVYCEVDGKEIDLNTGYEKGKKKKDKED